MSFVADHARQEPLDEELVRLMAAGDATALGLFYDRHSTLLHSIAIKVLGDVHESEEVLQDAMCQVWQRARDYDPSLGKPLSWAVVITRHRAIDRLRALRRKTGAVTGLAAEVIFNALADPSPPEGLCGEASRMLREALAALPPAQTVPIELAFYKGLSQTEIAAYLQVPLGTIKARIRRGMIAMRDALEERL